MYWCASYAFCSRQREHRNDIDLDGEIPSAAELRKVVPPERPPKGTVKDDVTLDKEEGIYVSDDADPFVEALGALIDEEALLEAPPEAVPKAKASPERPDALEPPPRRRKREKQGE